jgi:hypothetical protein
MRNPKGRPSPTVPTLVGALTILLTLAPTRASAQTADARDLVKQAHDRQRDFEMFRQSRIPVSVDRSHATCDQQIGRICIWYGGADEADFPREAPEVAMARRELIGLLYKTAEQAADPWVMGQLVHYMVENGDYGQAESVARACNLAETWWCSALLGYVLHVRGQFVEAEAAFRTAVASMPEKERKERWLTPRYIFTPDARKKFDKAPPEERARQWDLLWRLSDPLYLVDGNDRLTDHWARWVEATNERDAENPQGMFWEEDVEETLIRYGRIVGWSRTHNPGAMMRGRPGGFSLQDTRQIIGHHSPHSRGYLFPEEFLPSPSEIPPESWITAPREARTWYAPPYAPDFRALETQVGRFRRGDEMLVVGAYQEVPTTAADSALMAPDEPNAFTPRAADAQGGGSPLQAGLFLVPVDSGSAAEVRGTQEAGVFTLHAPPGRYVSSLEVFDAADKRAWRARQGVQQVPLVPGLVAVSDLLILDQGAQLPASLDEAIPHVRRGVRIRRGERFVVVWEVYGLRVQDPARVTLGFTKGRPGFLQRVGKFLGMLEPDQPVQVTFEDTGTDAVQTVFRSVALQLPDLEPGEYTLHLRLDLSGREPAIASRPIIVE